jgi:hypothetical protein
MGLRRLRGPEQSATDQLAREEADSRARASRLGQLQQTTALQALVSGTPTAPVAVPSPQTPCTFGRGVALLRRSQAGASSGAGLLS